jgi:hypothetical protein
MLSPEFPARKAPTAQLLPEHKFRGRLPAAQSLVPRVILFSTHRSVLPGSTVQAPMRAANR